MWMLAGKRQEDWDHTATLLVFLANALAGKSGKTAKLIDFHPYMEKPPRPVVDVAELSRIFKQTDGVKIKRDLDALVK